MARINLIKIRQGPARDFYNINSNNENSNNNDNHNSNNNNNNEKYNKDSKSNFLQIDGPINEMLF